VRTPVGVIDSGRLGGCGTVDHLARGDAVLTSRVTKELIARGVPRALSGAQREGLRERFGALTPRELDVARLIAEGMSNEEIAERLVLQPASVRRNVSRILGKFYLRDRVQIAVAWYKSFVIDIRDTIYVCIDFCARSPYPAGK